MTAKVFRHDKSMGEKSLSGQSENWFYKECKIKKQAIHNYRNLYKLMSIAPKLMKCQVSMTYFVKNHEIFLNYFEENEEQIPWKRNVYCACDACILYFYEE